MRVSFFESLFVGEEKYLTICAQVNDLLTGWLALTGLASLAGAALDDTAGAAGAAVAVGSEEPHPPVDWSTAVSVALALPPHAPHAPLVLEAAAAAAAGSANASLVADGHSEPSVTVAVAGPLL